MRLEELHAQHEIVHAVTNVRGVAVGELFTLEEYHREDQNRKYLVTSSNYSISLSDAASGGSGEANYISQLHGDRGQDPVSLAARHAQARHPGPQTRASSARG